MNDIQKNFRKVMEEQDKLLNGSFNESSKHHKYEVEKKPQKSYYIPSVLIVVCLILAWNSFGTRIMQIIPNSITGEYVTELEVHEFLQKQKMVITEVNEVTNALTRLEIDEIKRMVQEINGLSDTRKDKFKDLTVHTNMLVTILDRLVLEYSQYLETGNVEYLTRYNKEVEEFNENVRSQMDMIINLLKETGMRYVENDKSVMYWYNGLSY